MFELSKQFHFDAAHNLECEINTETNRRIHGHSYRAEITVAGKPDPKTGMVTDLGILTQALEALHKDLDHHYLNDIQDLGPPTMENLCVWIWKRLNPQFPHLARVALYRDSTGNSCVYRGPQRA